MLRTERSLLLLNTATKYSIEIVLEREVATAAPSTSLPLGRMTNMNSGSSTIFKMPPMAMPTLAWMLRPSERTR